MARSKNKFEINGSDLLIFHPENGLVACTTYRNDYFEEIKNITWNMKKGYPYNKKLGYLHRFVMKKWYGEKCFDEMMKNGYVVDHINNIHFDSRIENLEFLKKNKNTSKGHEFDVERLDIESKMALNIFKDFETNLYQITIFFNEPWKYKTNSPMEGYIRKWWLLYKDDYPSVLRDAATIIDCITHNKTLETRRLNFVKQRKEDVIIVPDLDSSIPQITIDRNNYITAIPPIKDWRID